MFLLFLLRLVYYLIVDDGYVVGVDAGVNEVGYILLKILCKTCYVAVVGGYTIVV